MATEANSMVESRVCVVVMQTKTQSHVRNEADLLSLQALNLGRHVNRFTL